MENEEEGGRGHARPSDHDAREDVDDVSDLDCCLYPIVISMSVKINQSFNVTEFLGITLALIIEPNETMC